METEAEESKLDSGPPPVTTPPTTNFRPVSSSSPSFSQLLAGAMSPRPGQQLVTVPVMAVPCFIAPATLLDSAGFTGPFAMTHQAVLASVTAQAQMQLQAAYSSAPEAMTNTYSHPMLTPIQPMPLNTYTAPEENVSTPLANQIQQYDQKSPSTQTVAKSGSTDGYNWRKYGQKQVKSSDKSRSYYKCTSSGCLAKKKVERCPDGRETEIIYRGKHNHEPPQKTRCTKERAQANECLDLVVAEPNEPDPSTSKTEENSTNEAPEQQLFCSSDCEGDPPVKVEEEPTDEPDPKRRICESTVPFSPPVLKTIKEPKIVVQSASEAGRMDDGYRWRKYGQKIVKGNPNPRSYYRCTYDGCPVRKHVERASDDAKAIIITYEGKHNHGQPALKISSDQPSSSLITVAAQETNSEPDQPAPMDTTESKKKSPESDEAHLPVAVPGTPLFEEKCSAVEVQNS